MDDIIASLNPKQQTEIVAIYDAEMQRLKGNPYAKDTAIERVFDKLSEYAPLLKQQFKKQSSEGFRTIGVQSRWRLSPSCEKRDFSEIHSSLTCSLRPRGARS